MRDILALFAVFVFKAHKVENSRNVLLPISQVAPTNVSSAEHDLNVLGSDGYSVRDVEGFGNNNRFAYVLAIQTPTCWEYKIVQFSFKQPLLGQRQLNEFGNQGWEACCIYSQGSNNMATVCVMKRPTGQLIDKIIEDSGAETESVASNLETDIPEVNELIGADEHVEEAAVVS